MSLSSYTKHKRFSREEIHNRKRKQIRSNKFISNTFKRDLLAMQQVWEMLKDGTIRWLGEVGRQY